MRKEKNFFFRVRIKNTISMLFVIGVVLAVLIFVLNVTVAATAKNRANSFMKEVVQDDGLSMLERVSGEKRCIALDYLSTYDSDMRMTGDWYIQRGKRSDFFIFSKSYWTHSYFSEILDKDFNITEVVHDYIFKSSAESNEKFFESALDYAIKYKKKNGRFYNVAFLLTPYESGYMFVVLDQTKDISFQKSLLLISLSVFWASMIVFFFVCWGISKVVVGAVEKVFRKMKRFMADVSHEIKTPIAVISANISVLEQEIPDNKWLGYIKMENERMGKMVKDMLYLAKVDMGDSKCEKILLDLSNVTACSVLPFECLAFEENKKLNMDLPDKPVYVFGDEEKIKQLVVILTDNAMKNSDKGGEILVTVGREGQKAFVRVYNTGHGVNPKEKEDIFTRFYRSDESRARASGGYGLGLPIAKSIATGHGGSIVVESEVGKYAQFTFYIPLASSKKHMEGDVCIKK